MKKKTKSKASPSFTVNDLELVPSVSETQDRGDQETILSLIASLYLDSGYSDLTIICKDEVFSAHKLLVCPRSEYFRKACYSGFKETENPIYLDKKDPILIEKVLEFLYTGNYTLRSRTPKSENPQTDAGEAPAMNTEPAGEPTMEPLPEELAIDEPAAEIGGGTDETAMAALENTAEGLVDESPVHQEPAPIDENLEKYPSEQRGVVEPVADTVADCHPSHFHVRMYGEADYFMIGDLKSKAEAHFRASFMNCPERESFTETIQEIYSTRANYQELRQLAIQMIVDNLPNLRTGLTPVIDPELMKSMPDFTYDLCQATLDRWMGHLLWKGTSSV